MFEKLRGFDVDPIMKAAADFRADARADKLDLTVGVYQDESGQTPVLSAVKAAEMRLAKEQSSKAYMPLTGDPEFCLLVGELVFGEGAGQRYGLFSAQTAGGAAALRVAADLMAALPGKPTVWIQTPTYSNYRAIFEHAGANVATLPYYDHRTQRIEFDDMMSGLNHAQPGDAFLFQGPCHNPTGADMSDAQLGMLLDRLQSAGIVPILDLAYLGFAKDFESDCSTARKVVDRFKECIICVSLSKSFGIYRDRTGALFVKSARADQAETSRALSALIRSNLSHAPDHGAAVVKTILFDPQLKHAWLDSLAEMSARVVATRRKIVQVEHEMKLSPQLSYLENQKGMFSLLPLTYVQEIELREKFGIFLVRGGRMNVARLADDDINRIIRAVHQVIEQDRTASLKQSPRLE